MEHRHPSPALLSSIYINMETPDCPTPSEQSKRPLQLLCFDAQSFSRVQPLCKPMDCALPDSSVLGISQARTFYGFPRPPPGNIADSGIKPVSPAFPELAGGFFTTVSPSVP